MKNTHLYLLASILTVIGLGLFLYKAWFLGFPLVPQKKSFIWDVEAHVTLNAINKPVKLSLFIPRNTDRFIILDENFISKGYGLTTGIEIVNRKAIWSIRKAKGQQSLYYKVSILRVSPRELQRKSAPPEIIKPEFSGAQLSAAESIIEAARKRSADTDSMVAELLKHLNEPQADDNVHLLLGKKASIPKKVNLAAKLLTYTGIPARSVHGIRLEAQRRDAPIVHWLEVYDRNQWRPFTAIAGEAGIPDDYLAWWKGPLSLIKQEGGENLKVTLSVMLNLEEVIRGVIERGKSEKSSLIDFSLFSLPIKTQTVYGVLLLIPVGAFLLVILRNVIGIKTFGTFMPVLIALAFRETQLLWGLILFSLLVALGLGIRLYLEHLKLLVVPRLASVLIVVILLMATLSILMHKLGLGHGLSIALFPMVIMTMTIERMSVLWEELGPSEALQQGVGSLIVAAFIYLVMTVKHVEHVFFVFPELLVVLLAGTLMLGRYSGYRLLELRRFKALTEKRP